MVNTTNTNIFNHDSKWNQWFAGLTDGDGCFYINKQEKSVSFEITTHTTDARVLYNIKNKLKAGSVKPRSGSHSTRYRVKKKSVILEIVQRLNGFVRNPVRMEQLKQVCKLYNLPFKVPSTLRKEDGYLSGLIDSDGSFSISVSNSTAENSQISGVEGRIIRLTQAKGFSQISLKVTSSHETYLEIIQNAYGYGIIYPEKVNVMRKSPNMKYHWTVRSYDDFKILYEYMKIHPLKSSKMHRMRLALLYFRYKTLNYHLKPQGTVEAKVWAKFSKSWYKYSF